MHTRAGQGVSCCLTQVAIVVNEMFLRRALTYVNAIIKLDHHKHVHVLKHSLTDFHVNTVHARARQWRVC